MEKSTECQRKPKVERDLILAEPYARVHHQSRFVTDINLIMIAGAWIRYGRAVHIYRKLEPTRYSTFRGPISHSERRKETRVENAHLLAAQHYQTATLEL